MARPAKPYLRKQTRSWYCSIGGRQISLGKDRESAFAKFHALMADQEQAKGELTTLYDLSQVYLDWCQANRKPATYELHRHYLKLFVQSVGKRLRPSQLKVHHVVKWHEGLGIGSTAQNVGLPRPGAQRRSLVCSGVVLNLGLCPYAGKGMGEVTLLQRLRDVLAEGDVLLADCLLGNWRCLYEMQQRGVAMVTRLNKALRTADFRKGQRVGKDDHLARWPKPHLRGVGRAAQLAMPRYLTVREVRVRIKQPGFRTKVN